MYLNLNTSFLGVSFEGETQDLKENLTPAQIHAGRTLTEMLRSRYHMAAENCVTHAQVSVNPDNMRIGYHTDWAANFPFHEMGLEDNYGLPIPALYLFGYGYDPTFVESTGARLWKGLLLAEERFCIPPARLGLSIVPQAGSRVWEGIFSRAWLGKSRRHLALESGFRSSSSWGIQLIES